ncbi:hypothetical protein ACWDX6_23855 [Streptomyces sp. NPDC003027]
MNFYMLPVSDVQEGDTVELAAENAQGDERNVLRVPVSRTRQVGEEVWLYSPKFKYPTGQPMPFYFASDTVVGVERP